MKTELEQGPLHPLSFKPVHLPRSTTRTHKKGITSVKTLSWGVDDNSGFLDIHVLPQGQAARHTNDTEVVKEVLQLAKDLKVSLVVMESTGGLERPLALDSRLLSNDGHIRVYSRESV